MKFFLPALAFMLLAGCNSNMATHSRDFSPSKGKGPWNDYRDTVRHGRAYEGKKELKDR